ncbi:hypothetical protein JCM16303_001305 [Sporobolomyces ruberrimus]
MFTRSALLSLLSLLVLALSSLHSAQAAMAQGDMNFTRDWIVQYDKSSYGSTETFCRRFRSACVDYVGPMNQHHQLDCVFDNGKVVQKGPKIHAFCGGLPKNADGSWTNDDSKVVDQTEAVIKQYMNAKVLSKPIGKAACEKFAKKHKKYADTIFSPV